MRLDTKKQFQKLLMRLCTPLKRHFSEGRAELHLGGANAVYGEKIGWMEAFSRPLWGLTPFWHGGGQNPALEQIYREGLASGTNPEHPEYWGEIRDCDQRMVEMAALGYGLLFAPGKLWEPLGAGEKQNLAKWLWQINEYVINDNNWLLFNILVNLGLKNVGAPFNQKRMDEVLSRVEDFYLGGGWYSDGKTDQRDYYISFAIHFYCLIYAKAAERSDAERSRLYKQRAEEFARDFVTWFDQDGRALAFGRSLTYRFAQTAFWSACVFAGVEAFSMEVMKGIIVRHFQRWMERPIFDNGGVLTVGYGYPNQNMAEGYNAPGSPYWAMKSFIILALPDGHPFWRAKAAPLPEMEELKVIPQARMIMQRQPHHVMALTSGQYAGFDPVHTPEKYSKFAYSSYFAFSVPRSYAALEKAAPDSMLAFMIDGMCYVRRKCDRMEIKDGQILSAWSPRPGIQVETTLIPAENGHIRRHRVTCDMDCVAYDCGFAISDFGADCVAEGGVACISGKQARGGIRSKTGAGVIIKCEPNTNLMFPHTAIPAAKYCFRKGTNLAETAVFADVLD